MFLAVVVGAVVYGVVASEVRAGSPGLPHLLYGTVTINGEPAQVGSVVTAKVNGVIQDSVTVTQPGQYGTSTATGDKLVVQDPGTIQFFIGGVSANETSTYSSGQTTNLPLTFSSVGAGFVAISRLNPAIDTDGVAVIEIVVDDYKDELTGVVTSTANGVESFSALLTYDSSTVEVLDVRSGPGFNASSTMSNTEPRELDVTGALEGGADPVTTTPAVLAKVVLRLIGSANSSTVIILASLGMTEANTGAQIAQETEASNSYQRGDTTGNGAVSIGDALFIAQCLVGLRDTGAASGECHPINAASVSLGGPSGAAISIGDALFIAQYLVGLRDDYFK